MSKRQLFSDLEKVNEYRAKIKENTDNQMEVLLKSGSGLEFLRKIKFEQSGYDPLFEEPTNFIEQVNQTFTYLVCLEAVEYLLNHYPGKSFYVCFGTEAGYDVESKDGSIICECFAATAPDSNGKLEKDCLKVHNNQVAEHKYVVFYSSTKKPTHIDNIRRKYHDVSVISLENI